MKLIDADELMAKVTQVKYLRKRKAQALCDECTEVDAVPVQFIIEWLNKGGEDKISSCLKEWEKQNEHRTGDSSTD